MVSFSLCFMVESNRYQTDEKDSNIDRKNNHTSRSEGKNWNISRRSVIKIAGATGAAVIPGTASVAADSQDDYEIIEVSADEREIIRVRSGETLSNKLIDVTASGASVRIDARGSDWTVRNIGVKGTMDVYDDMALLVGGEHGTVENIYLGDGCTAGRSKGSFVDHGSTNGPIEFRWVHIAGFPNNGIYGSPTSDLQGGIIHIRDSYFDSNNISQFKIGSPLGTCEVTNTVVQTDNSTPHNGFNQVNKRGIWALDGKTIIRDCDIQGTINTYDPATVEVENTRWGGDHNGDGSVIGNPRGTPDLSPPDGCPVTPEQAASGGGPTRSDDSSPQEPSIDDIWNDDESNHIVLSGGATDISEYRIVGHGHAEIGDDADTDPDDPYRDTTTTDEDEFTIRGYVGNATDNYFVQGAVTSVEIDENISVTVNDVEFDPTEIEGVGTWDDNDGDKGRDDASDEGSVNNTIMVDGSKQEDGISRYTFSVTGEVQQSDNLTSLADDRHPWDTLQSVVSNGEVTGIIGNGKDGYQYSGEVTTLKINGNADVSIDRSE